MALPNFYKLHMFNDTGVTLDFSVDDTIEVVGLPWKRVDGDLTYGSAITLLSTSADLADQAQVEGSEIDNTTNLYDGLFVKVKLTSDDSPDGNILFYLEWNSEDSSGQNDYPSDATDFDAARMDTDLTLVGILTPEGAADDQVATNFIISFAG